MNNLDKELGVIEKGLKITEKDLDINPVSGRHEVLVQQDMGDVNDAQADYEYQREQFYKLVDRGSVAIDGILELAKEGEHPRAYEVAGQLIKNVAEVTEKLGDLQKKMKELKEVPETGPKNVTNALFVGSTAELQKMIKGK
jgi:hypothetical protein|tara:strand:- start:267 stop:689 length:423 start_codon:yes stop_codon:yes gene_type:complete